jgi:ferrous iron transport protein A
MPTLDTLVPGQRGIIESIAGDDALVQRIWEMGLTEGEPVEVVAFAPLGDPIEIQIRSYNLSLRKSEASRIHVTLADDNQPNPG